MFAVSYVISFTFHPELEIDKVIIERGSGHSEYTPSLFFLKSFQYQETTWLGNQKKFSINFSVYFKLS